MNAFGVKLLLLYILLNETDFRSQDPWLLVSPPSFDVSHFCYRWHSLWLSFYCQGRRSHWLVWRFKDWIRRCRCNRHSIAIARSRALLKYLLPSRHFSLNKWNVRHHDMNDRITRLDKTTLSSHLLLSGRWSWGGIHTCPFAARITAHYYVKHPSKVGCRKGLWRPSWSQRLLSEQVRRKEVVV